jgi:hypothetical protein
VGRDEGEGGDGRWRGEGEGMRGMGLTGSKECKIKLQRLVIPHSTIMLLVWGRGVACKKTASMYVELPRNLWRNFVGNFFQYY